jgi:hypothetical protein
MIYSKWLPDKGGYAYYETKERRGLGDDLPTPRLSQTSSIGVASTDAGRALPLGAKIVGYGPIARGCVTVLDRSGLSGFSMSGSPLNSLVLVGAAAASVALGAILTRKVMR